MVHQAKKNYFNPFENFNTDNMPNPLELNRWKGYVERNMEFVSAANQVALDYAREIARRGVEVFQKQAQNNYECLKAASTCNSPEDIQCHTGDWMNSCVKNLFGSAREINEIASQAATEVIEICKKRGNEVVSDLNSKSAQGHHCNNAQPQSAKNAK
jgi:phasin family protein